MSNNDMSNSNLQLNEEGKLQHFLGIEGLNQQVLTQILDKMICVQELVERNLLLFL